MNIEIKDYSEFNTPYKYSYNPDNIIETLETIYGSIGTIIKEITRNTNNLPVKEVTYDKSLDIIVHKEIQYDNQGRKTEENIKYPKRSRDLQEIIRYEYDENGNVSTSKEILDVGSVRIEDETIRRENIPDDNGIIIGRKEYCMQRDGFSYKEIEYYDSYTQITIYNKDKAAVLIEKHYYSQHLQKVEEIYPMDPAKNKIRNYENVYSNMAISNKITELNKLNKLKCIIIGKSFYKECLSHIR